MVTWRIKGKVDTEWDAESKAFVQRHKTDFDISNNRSIWRLLISNQQCKLCGSGHLNEWIIKKLI